MTEVQGEAVEAADLSRWTRRPHRLAVDAKGYVWRVFGGGMWSMAPVNADNSPIPRPVTFYEPVASSSEGEAVEPQRECPQCGHLLGYRDKFCAECSYPWWPGTNPVPAARDGETWVRFYFSDADPVAECECGWRTIGDAAVDAFRAWWKHRASHYPEAS